LLSGGQCSREIVPLVFRRAAFFGSHPARRIRRREADRHFARGDFLDSMLTGTTASEKVAANCCGGFALWRAQAPNQTIQTVGTWISISLVPGKLLLSRGQPNSKRGNHGNPQPPTEP